MVVTVFPVSCPRPAVGLVDDVEVEKGVVIGGGDACRRSWWWVTYKINETWV